MRDLVQGKAEPTAFGILQRKSTSSFGVQGACSECQKKEEENLQRLATGPRTFLNVPASVRKALHSPGAQLDSGARAFFEPRFGHDFSKVRVHADSTASESARAVNALAYTVGHDIVLSPEHYQPATAAGRRLLAHELTHVVQQRVLPRSAFAHPLTLDRPDSPLEREAQAIEANVFSADSTPAGPRFQASQPVLSRADPNAVARTQNLRGVVGSGVQFLPPTITSTQVGPPEVRGGLLDDRSSRLNVVIGENLTLRLLAQQILPLWTAATPFTPPGSTTPDPLPSITADDLARGLFVYNQNYLPGLTMDGWRTGLRFPLPVRIDETTGVGTLHPSQIQALASAFDPAWEPKLDLHARATVTPPASTLQADVTAFLAREPSALARGIHLGAQALTNAVATLPFIVETFRQLGPDAFEVALNFMDYLVNHEISILAAQRDGAAVLAAIRKAVGAAPATPTAAQQERMTRAIKMLDLVTGVAAAAKPEEFFDPCHPVRPLTWADYSGPVGGGFAANTAWTFPLVTTGAGDRLRAVFDPGRSWVEPRSGHPTDSTRNGCGPIPSHRGKVDQCQAAVARDRTFFIERPSPDPCPAGIIENSSIVASTAADCSGTFAAECARVAVEESARLLRHEQLHFDIACILAGKANAGLAAGRPMAAVRPALTARSNQVTIAYDNQTRHGCLDGPQATWEKDVAGGLPSTTVP